MASSKSARAQLVSSRIAAILALTIVILASQTEAKPKSSHEETRDVTYPDSNGYKPTPGIGQHKIHTNATTWHEALRICEEEGSYLAIINSRNESRAIAELAKSQAHVGTHNSNYVLVGFNDIDKEGEYVTVDGKSLTESGFVEWSRTEPNNQNGWHSENCGSVRKTDGKLNDIYCDKKYAFICEKRQIGIIN